MPNRITPDAFFALAQAGDTDLRLHEVEIHGLHLSCEQLGDLPCLSFSGAVLVDCSFTGAGAWFGQLLACDFRRCRISGLHLNKSEWLGTQFFDCDIAHIDAHGLEIHSSSQFVDCRFQQLSLRHSFICADFWRCHFETCLLDTLQPGDGLHSFRQHAEQRLPLGD